MRYSILIFLFVGKILFSQNIFTDSFDSDDISNWMLLKDEQSSVFQSNGDLKISCNSEITNVVHLIPIIGSVASFNFNIMSYGTDLIGDAIFYQNGNNYYIYCLYQEGYFTIVYKDGADSDDIVLYSEEFSSDENTHSFDFNVLNDNSKLTVELKYDDQLLFSGDILSPSEELQKGQVGFSCWGDVIDISLESATIEYVSNDITLPYVNDFVEKKPDGILYLGNYLQSSYINDRLEVSSIIDELSNVCYFIPPTGNMLQGAFEVNGGGLARGGALYRMNGKSYTAAIFEDDTLSIVCFHDDNTVFQDDVDIIWDFTDKSVFMNLSENNNKLDISIYLDSDMIYENSISDIPEILKSGAFGYSIWGDTIDININKFAVYNDVQTEIEKEEIIAHEFTLYQNYPNPFNPTTNIRYDLKYDTKVYLNIYNQKGQIVRTLVNNFQTKGSYITIWDGCDNNGNSVANGIYFVKLNNEDLQSTKKIVLLK